jgi:hypothetical protein
MVRPKKIYVCLRSPDRPYEFLHRIRITILYYIPNILCQMTIDLIDIWCLLLSAKPEIVVSGIRFRYFIFEISGKPNFSIAEGWPSYDPTFFHIAIV